MNELSQSKRPITFLTNPFVYIAGGESLLLGLAAILIAAVIGLEIGAETIYTPKTMEALSEDGRTINRVPIDDGEPDEIVIECRPDVFAYRLFVQ